MTYKELIRHLQDRHFYPQVLIATPRLMKQGDEPQIEALMVECAPILSDSKLEKLKESLPDGFTAEYVSDHQRIYIRYEQTKKAKGAKR